MENWTKQEVMELVKTVFSIAGTIVAIVVAFMVRTVHVLMNSRLTQLLKSSTDNARAEGKEAGRSEEEARASKQD